MSTHPFSQLTPDFILNAVESVGLWCDARIYPLNSYENRVYQVGIEDQPPLIAKFYRPNRWNREQILEEHQLLLRLKAENLPVLAPKLLNNESLFWYEGFAFCLYEKQSGQAPEADNMDHLFATGELLGQLHNAMSKEVYQTRAPLNPVLDFEQAFTKVINSQWLPKKQAIHFHSIRDQLIPLIRQSIEQYWPTECFSIHADCHRGNLLHDQDQLYILDFDDSKQGPAVQDLWLHLSGSITQQKQQLSELIEGYESYRPFDNNELQLIDSLKACRLMQYAAWLDTRWDDPAFPQAFPWFKEEDYWQNLSKDLTAIIDNWGMLTS